MKVIKNIVFDFGGILLDIDIPTAFENMRKTLSLKKKDGDTIPKEIVDILQSYEVGAINTETFIWKLQFISPKTPQAIKIVKAWNSMLLEMSGEKFDQLLELKKKYNLYLLSNINDLHLEWVYRYFRIEHGVEDWDDRYFEKTYYSHIMGRRKPDLSTFEFVWEDAGILPEESLFIDDTLENIVAANKLNINTIHHNPKEDIFEVLEKYFK